jgi:hypothetical protein
MKLRTTTLLSIALSMVSLVAIRYSVAPPMERILPVTEFPDQWFPRLRIEFVMNLALHGQQVFAKAYDAAVGKEGKFRKVSG